jgi:hypothetical protein
MHLFIRKNVMIDNVLNDQIKTGVYPTTGRNYYSKRRNKYMKNRNCFLASQCEYIQLFDHEVYLKIWTFVFVNNYTKGIHFYNFL